MAKRKSTKSKKDGSTEKKVESEREFVQLDDPNNIFVIRHPGREHGPVLPTPAPSNCKVRFFQFSKHTADADVLNMNVEILALVTGGVRNITVLAVEEVTRIHPVTGEEVTHFEPIIIDGMAIGDSKDYDCEENIIRATFQFSLLNLRLREFRIEARLTDCCGTVHETPSPVFIYA